jgi:hypothetical protein
MHTFASANSSGDRHDIQVHTVIQLLSHTQTSLFLSLSLSFRRSLILPSDIQLKHVVV